jgi:hypothetical protein
MVWCTTGEGYNAGVLEYTIMSEKEALESAGCPREANRIVAASTSQTPPIGAKAHGGLQGILHRLKKVSPTTWVDVKPDLKPRAKTVGETRSRVPGGRETRMGGGGLGDLNLGGLDAAQMDDLGGVTYEIVTAPMEILTENEVSGSGEEPGVDTQRTKVLPKEKGPITQEHHSSKLEPVLFILVKVVMICIWATW